MKLRVLASFCYVLTNSAFRAAAAEIACDNLVDKEVIPSSNTNKSYKQAYLKARQQGFTKRNNRIKKDYYKHNFGT